MKFSDYSEGSVTFTFGDDIYCRTADGWSVLVGERRVPADNGAFLDDWLQEVLLGLSMALPYPLDQHAEAAMDATHGFDALLALASKLCR